MLGGSLEIAAAKGEQQARKTPSLKRSSPHARRLPHVDGGEHDVPVFLGKVANGANFDRKTATSARSTAGNQALRGLEGSLHRFHCKPLTHPPTSTCADLDRRNGDQRSSLELEGLSEDGVGVCFGLQQPAQLPGDGCGSVAVLGRWRVRRRSFHGDLDWMFGVSLCLPYLRRPCQAGPFSLAPGQRGRKTGPPRRPVMDSNDSAKILVVDDNEANRLLAQQTLEDEGYQVILATGGAEGVAAFTREAPDCILLDVRMPEVDGFAACRQVRGLPGGEQVPIVFLTALRDVDTFDSALRAGGDDFLTKPVRPTELVVRVQTALKLRRMRAELGEQYDLLKHQRDDLMRVQLQKERLMSFVVHDLKNPVNSMDLFAQLLLRERGLSDSGKDAATHIRHEARQLLRLILNLLDISKADEGKLTAKRARVNLRSLVDEVAGELEGGASARKVTVTTSLGIDEISGDEDLLRRMLTNLIENAIRHAPAESRVSVESNVVSAAVDLRVRDAGRGIPVEMREKIFDPFLQLDATSGSSSRGGRGLGLTFCKLAAEAHGGTIWVEDASPGAVLCVRLPQ